MQHNPLVTKIREEKAAAESEKVTANRPAQLKTEVVGADIERQCGWKGKTLEDIAFICGTRWLSLQ